MLFAQNKAIVYFSLFSLALALVSSVAALSLSCNFPTTCNSVHNQTFQVKTRDGQNLSVLVYFPWAGSKPKHQYPTVLSFTMYGKEERSLNIAPKYLSHCFVVVVVDQRGRYQSSGDYNFFQTDGKDAFDVMKWIQSRSWSNRKIFSYGVSGDGITAYLEPQEHPRWLKGQYVLEASAQLHMALYRGGSLDLDLLGIFDYIGRPDYIPEVLQHEADGYFWNLTRDMTSKWNDPGLNLPPSVHYGGWYDIFQRHTIDAFNAYRKKSPSWLVFGPYAHCSGGGDITVLDSTWELEYGLNLSIALFREINRQGSTPCYSCLRQKLSAFPSILMFVMGPDVPSARGNFYTTFEDWPSSSELSFYLGSGSLTLEPNESESSLNLVYDPNNPAPTIGGTNLFIPCGPRDQTPLLNRSDVLAFTSDYFEEDFAVLGNIYLSLYVSSDRNDTDFVAKLTDLYPDGRSELLTDGLIRMKWRDNSYVPTPMIPGKIYHVLIDIWGTGYIFNRGHRIQLIVTSSSYPKFSVNPNNGRLVSEGGPNLVAVNTVYFGGSYASKLILPKVRLEDLVPN